MPTAAQGRSITPGAVAPGPLSPSQARAHNRAKAAQRHGHMVDLLTNRTIDLLMNNAQLKRGHAGAPSTRRLPSAKVTDFIRTETSLLLTRGEVTEKELKILANEVKQMFGPASIAGSEVNANGGGGSVVGSAVAASASATSATGVSSYAQQNTSAAAGNRVPPLGGGVGASSTIVSGSNAMAKKSCNSSTVVSAPPAPASNSASRAAPSYSSPASASPGSSAFNPITQRPHNKHQLPPVDSGDQQQEASVITRSYAMHQRKDPKKKFQPAYIDDDLWAKMCIRQAAEFHHDVVKGRKAAKQRLVEQQAVLEQQVERKKQDMIHRVEEEEHFAAEEAKRIEKLRQLELVDAQKVKQKHVEQQKECLEQVFEARERRKKEAELVKLEALIERQKLEKLAEEERITKEIAKEKAKREYKEKILENDELQQRKRERRWKEAEENAEAERIHQERLAKEEAAREEEMVKMFAKQRKQLKVAERLQESMDEKAARDAERAAAYTAKQNALAEERARKEKEKKIEMRQQLQQTLALQVEERKRVQVSRIERDREERRRVALAAKVYQEEEKAALEEKRQRRLANVKELDEQISVERSKKLFVMSDDEKRLNARLLRQLNVPV